MYCPGITERFTEADLDIRWLSVPTFHIIGYALTAPGTGLAPSNQNRGMIAGPTQFGLTTTAPTSPSQRALLADATISQANQYDYLFRTQYNWTSIPSSLGKPYTSPHLNGLVPSGGNVAMLDGHVEWRPFDEMRCRSVSGNGFWW